MNNKGIWLSIIGICLKHNRTLFGALGNSIIGKKNKHNGLIPSYILRMTGCNKVIGANLVAWYVALYKELTMVCKCNKMCSVMST